MKQLKILTLVFVLLFFPLVFAHHEPEHTQCPPGECPRDVDSFVEEVINAKLTNAGIISLAFLVIGTVALAFKGLKKKKKDAVKIIVNIVILALIVLMGYSYYYFNTTASETTGIVVCEAGECFWAAHIHSLLYIDICGEQIDIGLEEGLLEGTHTHKEKNKLHFHERLTVDPETREVTDFTPLEIETVLNDFGIETSDGCIAGKCIGDMCNGKLGSWVLNIENEYYVMTASSAVEGIPLENYTWKEKDIITISFK
jgi:hypothetical protein